jgi:hypothetical protein
VSDQFDPTDRAVARRGRRDPALALELEGVSLADQGNEDDAGDFGLVSGDQMVFKIVREIPDVATGRDRWITFGASTSVLDGETAEVAASRLYETVSTTFDRIVDVEDQAAQAAAEAARHRPITPQRRTN